VYNSEYVNYINSAQKVKIMINVKVLFQEVNNYISNSYNTEYKYIPYHRNFDKIQANTMENYDLEEYIKSYNKELPPKI
jgi:hypothetical protein